MLSEYFVVWRSGAGQLVSTIADKSKSPRAMDRDEALRLAGGREATELSDLETIVSGNATFDRIAAPRSIVRSVLGWDV